MPGKVVSALSLDDLTTYLSTQTSSAPKKSDENFNAHIQLLKGVINKNPQNPALIKGALLAVQYTHRRSLNPKKRALLKKIRKALNDNEAQFRLHSHRKSIIQLQSYMGTENHLPLEKLDKLCGKRSFGNWAFKRDRKGLTKNQKLFLFAVEKGDKRAVLEFLEKKEIIKNPYFARPYGINNDFITDYIKTDRQTAKALLKNKQTANLFITEDNAQACLEAVIKTGDVDLLLKVLNADLISNILEKKQPNASDYNSFKALLQMVPAGKNKLKMQQQLLACGNFEFLKDFFNHYRKDDKKIEGLDSETLLKLYMRFFDEQKILKIVSSIENNELLKFLQIYQKLKDLEPIQHHHKPKHFLPSQGHKLKKGLEHPSHPPKKRRPKSQF